VVYLQDCERVLLEVVSLRSDSTTSSISQNFKRYSLFLLFIHQIFLVKSQIHISWLHPVQVCKNLIIIALFVSNS